MCAAASLPPPSEGTIAAAGGGVCVRGHSDTQDWLKVGGSGSSQQTGREIALYSYISLIISTSGSHFAPSMLFPFWRLRTVTPLPPPPTSPSVLSVMTGSQQRGLVGDAAVEPLRVCARVCVVHLRGKQGEGG